MLNDLRQILEEDNRIESDFELMMEGTDADMVDMFIDEDGEAEIPESELTKILTKIPEYNQEEELNKKLKRLTESVIPDYELLEEKSTFKDKLIRFRDDDPLVYDGFLGAQIAGIPGLIIGVAASGEIRDAVYNDLQGKVVAYTKGDPLNKQTITKLLDACRTKNDIKKFEKWVKKVYRNLKVVTRDDPEMQVNIEEFRNWIRDEIIQKEIKVKRARILSGVSEAYDYNDYEIMTDEEFCEAMDAEYEEYKDLIEEGAVKSAVLGVLDKYNRIMDNIRADMGKTAIYGAAYITADMVLTCGIPSLIIAPVVAPAGALGAVAGTAVRNAVTKQVAKIYTKGDPLSKKMILDLLNACQTKKDLNKYIVWLGIVYGSLANVSKNSPEVQEDIDGFRDWIKNEVKHKALPAKKELIKAQAKEMKQKAKENKKVKESYDFDDEFNDYDIMTDKEFCEAMDAEYEEYMNTIEEHDDYECEKESYSIFEEASSIVDEILYESKESREAKRDANMEKSYRQSAAQINTPEEIKNIIKKNKELCKQIKAAINSKEAKQEDSGKIKKLLSQFKDTILFMKYDPCNPSEDTPLYILKRNLKNNAICERVLKERLKELQKSGK